MKNIKVLGPGCAKCKNTYKNVLEAIEQTGVAAEVVKIEDIDEMLKYNILVTPVLMIDGEAKVKGRVPDVAEIKILLSQ
jgi:small redox-active disulfide protein 2